MKQVTLDMLNRWRAKHLMACEKANKDGAMQYQSWMWGAHAVGLYENDNDLEQITNDLLKEMRKDFNEAFDVVNL